MAFTEIVNAMPKKEYIREYRNKRRQYAKDKLGGKCAFCGSLENLQFDHIDPSSKKTNISNLWTAKLSAFDEELAKCQLLCYGCHHEKSQSNGDYVRAREAWHHGVSGYMNHKCRCDECKAAYRIWRKERWLKEKR